MVAVGIFGKVPVGVSGMVVCNGLVPLRPDCEATFFPVGEIEEDAVPPVPTWPEPEPDLELAPTWPEPEPDLELEPEPEVMGGVAASTSRISDATRADVFSSSFTAFANVLASRVSFRAMHNTESHLP